MGFDLDFDLDLDRDRDLERERERDDSRLPCFVVVAVLPLPTTFSTRFGVGVAIIFGFVDATTDIRPDAIDLLEMDRRENDRRDSVECSGSGCSIFLCSEGIDVGVFPECDAGC